MNKKTIACILALIMFAMPLTACASEVDMINELQIGIVLPNQEALKWIQAEQWFKEALEGSDFSYEILFSQDSPTVELSHVNNLLSKGIEVLIISPSDEMDVQSVEAAKSHNVTVITYDRMFMNTEAVDYHVTFDAFAIGEAQGKYLSSRAVGMGSPLYLFINDSSISNKRLYFKGVWNALQPKISDGTFDLLNSDAAIELQSKQELTDEEIDRIIAEVGVGPYDLSAVNASAETIFVLASDDNLARQIADETSSQRNDRTLVITGQDAEIPSVQYIIDGTQTMTVFKDVRRLVSSSLIITLAVLDGQKTSTELFMFNGSKYVATASTGISVVDQSNLYTALIESGYFDQSDFSGLD